MNSKEHIDVKWLIPSSTPGVFPRPRLPHCSSSTHLNNNRITRPMAARGSTDGFSEKSLGTGANDAAAPVNTKRGVATLHLWFVDLSGVRR